MASRKRMTAAQRRAQLIDVGRAIFAQHGYEASTVEQIAREAGVSKPIVYEHFGGKEGLYAVVVDRESQAIVERVSRAVSDGSPRERFERGAVAFLRYVQDNPHGFAVLARDAPVTVATGSMRSVLTEIANKVEKIFVTEFERAGYDPSPAPIYAHALVGMVTFVGQWWTDDTREPPVEEVARHIATLGWMGLRHLPRAPKMVFD